jgi:hypothetical protein
MTSFRKLLVKCRLCGRESQQAVLLSSNTYGGPPDLDGRPTEMLRQTMGAWVRRCPACGYCAMHLSHDHEYDLPVAPMAGHDGVWVAPEEPPPDSPARTTSEERHALLLSIVRSERYTAQLHDRGLPELANSFLCTSLIDQAEGRQVDATFAALHAAWTCDDASLPEQARSCRLRATELILSDSRGSQSFGIRLRSRPALLADLFRRCGDFDSASATCREALAADPEVFLRNVLGFQIQLIDRHDTAAHSLGEAILSSPEAWGIDQSSRSEAPKRGWRFWRH